jgi:hypothetical protein
LLGGERRQCSVCNDDVDLEVYQLGGQRGQSVRVIICVSVLNDNILAFNPAQFTEALNESSFESRATLRTRGTRAQIRDTV